VIDLTRFQPSGIETVFRHLMTNCRLHYFTGLAPKLVVSVHWLETGQQDPAERLALLVLEHQGRPLPASATGLANAVLRTAR
jgi:hypothetical protein